MIDEGFLNQLLISTDPTTDRMKKYSGTVGIDYILTQLIPLLELSGFSEDDFFKMTHLNTWNAVSMIQI